MCSVELLILLREHHLKHELLCLVILQFEWSFIVTSPKNKSISKARINERIIHTNKFCFDI